MTDDVFTRHLRSTRVLAILRGHGQDRTLQLCRQAWQLGIELVEIPVQSTDDLEALRSAVAAGAQVGRPVGAGTVTSAQLVETVAAAGAAFTVAPGLDGQVAAASRSAGLPHLPGVGSATEVHRAVQLGFTWQKAFPARLSERAGSRRCGGRSRRSGSWPPAASTSTTPRPSSTRARPRCRWVVRSRRPTPPGYGAWSARRRNPRTRGGLS